MSTETDSEQAGHDSAAATVLERMLAAGISEARARDALSRSAVHVAGEPTDDPGALAPWPTPWTIHPT